LVLCAAGAMDNLETMTTQRTSEDHEVADFVETLATHRSFLRQTVQGLDDKQAAEQTTVSELCLGGLIKHVTLVEARWADFIVRGAQAMGSADEDSTNEHTASFQMQAGETLAVLLKRYEEVADRTDALVASLPSMDASHPLPEAPWFDSGAEWSARRVLLHIIAETSQHAGHADIIREALDGAKTMG
jgi:hypothetical protein